MLLSNGVASRDFDQIYRTLFPTLYRVAYRICLDQGLAEDICQEAFMRYLRRPAPLPDLDQTKYWLLRVVRNLSLNVEKRRKREFRANRDVTRAPRGTRDETADDEVLRSETQSAVHDALGKLPVNLRTPLVMREYGGLSYREIAGVLHLSESNVKVRVFRARQRLAKILDPSSLHVS
jgi:RNA polymerase sigma-70 factor (ECF subfamily)